VTIRGDENARLYIHGHEQVAQLSQRDRVAGWVSYSQTWKTGTGRKYLRTGLDWTRSSSLLKVDDLAQRHHCSP